MCVCVCVCECNIIVYACGLSTNESYLHGIRPIELCIGKENVQPSIPVKPVQWYFFARLRVNAPTVGLT